MKKTLTHKVILAIFSLILVAMPVLVSAALLPPAPYNSAQSDGFAGTTNLTVYAILMRIMALLLQFAGIIAVLFIIYGGYRYVTAGGNEDASESAKHIIFNSVIGFAVILLSWVILKVVENTVS